MHTPAAVGPCDERVDVGSAAAAAHNPAGVQANDRQVLRLCHGVHDQPGRQLEPCAHRLHACAPLCQYASTTACTMGLISGEGCPVPPSDQQISLLPSLLVDVAVGAALAIKPRKFRHSVPFCMQACNPFKLKILQECYHRRKGSSMDNSKSKAAASIKRSQTDSQRIGCQLSSCHHQVPVKFRCDQVPAARARRSRWGA